MTYQDFLDQYEWLKEEELLNRETSIYLVGVYDEAYVNEKITKEEKKVLKSKLPLKPADLELINA